ncbi:hypothetical protein M1328_02465 [Patescibacteria group bacterium]|nr:hypothetical protein [Patescibacteria group bacterium]
MNDTKQILEKLKKFKVKQNDTNWLFVLLILFLAVNIYFSQNISNIFFGLVNGDKKSTTQFLQKIKNTPDFNKRLVFFETIYGPSIKDEVFSQEIKMEMTIKQLEQMLSKNPQSRDILYALYQLYTAKGDQLTASSYLQRAKTVDPMIK